MKKHYPSALPDPFPAAPRSLGKTYHLQFERGGATIELHGFAAFYSAKKFLDALFVEDKWKWLKKDRIGFKDIEIQCDELEEILEVKYTPMEASWQLPEPYVTYAKRLRGEKPPKRMSAEENPAKQQAVDKPRSALINQRKAPKREMPDGMIGIADICQRLKIEPRIARGILRANVDKPEHGWAWSKADAVKIEKLLKEKSK